MKFSVMLKKKIAFLWIGLLNFLSIAACAPVGDFGRPTNSVWHTHLLPTAGSVIARGREEPVSSFPFTDDEQELRARLWHFAEPAHGRGTLDRYYASYAQSRILPLSALESTSEDHYWLSLRRETFISPVAQYRRMAQDIAQDAQLLIALESPVRRVLNADEFRCAALQRNIAKNTQISRSKPSSTMVRPTRKTFNNEDNTRLSLDGGDGNGQTETDLMRGYTESRIHENQQIIEFLAQVAMHRQKAYRYALEQLSVETPHAEAITVERILAGYAQHKHIFIAQINTDNACIPSSNPIKNVEKPKDIKTPLASKFSRVRVSK
jgi:hypothetical protein